MPNRTTLTGLLLLLLLSACGDTAAPAVDPAPDGASAPPPTTFAPAAAPETPSAYATEKQIIDGVKGVYDRVQQQIAAGTMRQDSFPYLCEEVAAEGQIKVYDGADGLKLVTHSYSQGDHSGATEEYYFRDGQLVFLFVEEGYWRFGGPMTKLDDGSEVPGTVDEITQSRRYFNADTLVKALTKSYQLNSWEDNDGLADRTPNRVESQPQRPFAALQLIRSVMTTRSVACEQVRYMN